MKTHICLLPMLLLGLKAATAQDTIMQTDGTKIIAVVQEVGTTEIKYKKYATLQTSPVYDISKTQVTAIHYADGTKDMFPAVQTPQYNNPAPTYSTGSYVTTTYNADGTVTTAPSNLTGATMYLGAMVSPFTPYNGAAINSYYQNKFANDGAGTVFTNSGSTQMYNFFMGGSLIFNKQNNWTYEFQFETTPGNAIHDSANYADGSHGVLNVSYFSLNDALQYLRGTDTSNRFQVGGELSLDIGIFTGSESDVIYSGGTYPNNNSTLYDGMQIGWHAAAVAKYFVGKGKNLGFIAKLGYRGMNLSTENEFDQTGTPINFNGVMFSLGLVLQMQAHATVCVNCYDSGYYDY